MTTLGVFARVFPAGTAEDVAAAVRGAGFTTTQLNLTAIGRPTLDRHLDQSAAQQVRMAFTAAGVDVWGLSGTFNAIHPDPGVRSYGIAGCAAVITAAPATGATAVTLCTGTRDPDDMWRAHPDNTSPQAWDDLRLTLDHLIPVAAAAGIRLGIEPEAGNVVSDAAVAARLLAQLGDDAQHVGIVLDPANLLDVSTVARQDSILGEAFAALGDHTIAVHAKDVVSDGYAAPGVGTLDYDLVMRLHHQLPHDVPVIAQDLTADDAPRVHAFLRQHAEARATPPR